LVDFNIGIALSAVIGLITGAMLVFYLIADSTHRVRLFGLIAVIFATLGILTLIIGINAVGSAVANAIVGLISLLLSAFLGYALTTYFLLGRPERERSIIPDLRQATLKLNSSTSSNPPRTAIIYYANCEPDSYSSLPYNYTYEHLQAHGMAAPPILARPFTMRRARQRYAKLGHSPQRGIHTHIAQKLRDKLGKRYRVYIAFSDNHPFLDEMAAGAVLDGARRLIVARPALDAALNGSATSSLLQGLRMERMGVEVRDAPALHDSDALVRLYLRRVNASVGEARDEVGVLLIGQRHDHGESRGEAAFRERLTGALVRSGIAAQRIASITLPSAASLGSAFSQLQAGGAKQILAMPLTYSADSVTLLTELPSMLEHAHAQNAPATHLITFGGWNDDDALIDAMAERVRAVA
jgi:Ferrochelatase